MGALDEAFRLDAHSPSNLLAMCAAEQQEPPLRCRLRTGWTTERLTLAWLPAGAEMLSLELSYGTEEVVFKTADAVGLLLQQPYNALLVTLWTRTREQAELLLQTLQALYPAAEPRERQLQAVFWYWSAHGPQSLRRSLDAPLWADVARNYAPATAAALAPLMDLTPGQDEAAGKLLLWRGAPGTGKTFALRALAMAWRSWCQVHYVMDPDVLFSEASYLCDVALAEPEGQEPRADGAPRWRLVVLEDTGEMLARDAKQQEGQRLSRLLNVCDGLLGQGTRTLFLITTNEEVRTLHDAVRRPGRCLADVSFEPFAADQAADWLADHGVRAELLAPLGPQTLATLYARLDGRPVEARAPLGLGYR